MKQIAQTSSGCCAIRLYFGWSSIVAVARRGVQHSERVQLSHRAGE